MPKIGRKVGKFMEHKKSKKRDGGGLYIAICCCKMCIRDSNTPVYCCIAFEGALSLNKSPIVHNPAKMCIRDRLTAEQLGRHALFKYSACKPLRNSGFADAGLAENNGIILGAVSYTHLDVYKRQYRQPISRWSRTTARRTI